MRKIVVTYKGMVVKDINSPFVQRAVAGDVVTVTDDDAALLIGMGRARLYEPPKEPKKEGVAAPTRPERKKE